MKMFSLVGDFFALDIGTSAVRIVQLSRSGDLWTLDRYISVPVDVKIANSDSLEDQRKLAEVITTAIGQSGVHSKNVVLGVPSSRVFATVVELPDMPAAELENTIKYQAEQFIPMSIDEAKVDWAVLGKAPKDVTKNEILLASVSKAFSEQRLDLVEGLGLNVLAFEPDSVALCRALLASGMTGGRVILDVGDLSTDLIIALGDAPRLIRSIPTGFRTLVKAAAQNLNIQEQQAMQFVLKFGLQPDKLEGQILKALEGSMSQFVAEIVKSVKFFQTKYPDTAVSEILFSGYGSTIPALDAYVSQKVGVVARVASPWAKIRASEAQQAELQRVATDFSVAVGLAQKGDL